MEKTKLKTPYDMTWYAKPNGEKSIIPFYNMYKEDYDWFREKEAFFSGEEFTRDGFAFYLDVGIQDEEGEPIEAIITCHVTDCPWDTIHILRKNAEKLIQNKGISG